MIKLLVLSFLAAASAAPQFNHHRHSPFSQDFHNDFDVNPYFGEEMFDTHRFWLDLELQLRQMDSMLQDFHRHFPKSTSSAGVVGHEYKVVIALPGFEEKDVIVKAREGVLMVQAVHKSDEGSHNNYIDIRTLPANVDVSGVWTFEDGVVTIVFPIKGVSTTTEAPSTTPEMMEAVTRGLGDREEMGNGNSYENDNQDADVGVSHNVEKDHAIRTNEIQRGIEATTYAIDLKDEVEFVPVHYK
ncbi:unnamed protein product [Chilo suppressalis]|uniref:Heat shock protein 27.3 n=1 Tax=Chilo suppressalis TaxID=168631 RepID=A0A514MHV3_CHISP|nr:heat shock protein 27.3 [Chilo suppressalis]CAH0405145.1 unnamed protein product [Chilo suppressalis]